MEFIILVLVILIIVAAIIGRLSIPYAVGLVLLCLLFWVFFAHGMPALDLD